jgi:RNA polymerase sigma factor (TIGR02999 family)
VSESITSLLRALRDGDRSALDRLAPLVYDRLRRMARARMRGERAGHTLDTTGLVHEAYLELVAFERVDWRDRAHFFAVAARAMRNVLVDHAERRRAAKRGGGVAPLALDEEIPALQPAAAEEILALNTALERLRALDPRQERVVECRFFAGMTIEETAAALGVAPATVKRDWETARAWLNRELGG